MSPNHLGEQTHEMEFWQMSSNIFSGTNKDCLWQKAGGDLIKKSNVILSEIKLDKDSSVSWYYVENKLISHGYS